MPKDDTQEKEKNSYIDPEVERFARENREMIERLLKEERQKALEALDDGEKRDPKEFISYHENMMKETFDREKSLVEDLASHNRQRLEDTAKGIVSMFMDPDFQRHMVSAGLEMFMAFDALMKVAPLPEFAREAADKARETGENATKAYCEKNPSCSNKTKKVQQLERVKIE